MSTDTAGSVTVMIRLLRGRDRKQVPVIWETLLRAPDSPGPPDREIRPDVGARHRGGCGPLRHRLVLQRDRGWQIPVRGQPGGPLGHAREDHRAQGHAAGPALEDEVSFEDLPSGSSSGDDGAGQLAIVEPTPEYKGLVNWCWPN